MTLTALQLTDGHFKKISRLVYESCGIKLKDGKEALVRARIMKRIRALGMGSFGDYIRYIESDKGAQELGLMIDVMTTNKTSFFRESAHFDLLRDTILPDLKNGRMRIWSAACSSGEEPFTISIVLKENIPDIEHKDVRILATDISARMLAKAREASYSEETVQNLPRPLLQKYFIRVQNGHAPAYRAKESIRALIKLAWLNLMAPWPMKGPFNIIFCRNVMIYFDRQTQQRLINRFWDLLQPGGYLFVGHSEGLSSISHKFRYIKPAVYMK